MRILKITQAYHPFQSRGAPAFKIRSIARALTELGNKVAVLTADLGFGPAEIAATAAFENAYGWGSNMDGVETIYLRTQGRYRNLTLNGGVAAFCRRRLREFEIVHVYGLYDTLGPTVAHYCRGFGIPYFVEPLGMTRPIDRGFFLKKVWTWATPRYLRRASRMIATSVLEREELLACGFRPEQVLLRYNGIDSDEFQQLPPPGSFRNRVGLGETDVYILFLGRLIPRKGADLLIEALPQVEATGLKLVIAGPEGEAGYSAFLQAKARRLGLERQVIFVGPLYGGDKTAALADALVFALPSRYENFGNAAAEAIACGTPAIVSDRCGIAPLLDGRAGLVTTYDANAIVQTLKCLLGKADLYQRLKNGCREVAAELSWQKLVQGLQDSYEASLVNSFATTTIGAGRS
jgi:glycosyltransferase involved in cell wall biosynthesis